MRERNNEISNVMLKSRPSLNGICIWKGKNLKNEVKREAYRLSWEIVVKMDSVCTHPIFLP